jgi:hypothetical protein
LPRLLNVRSAVGIAGALAVFFLAFHASSAARPRAAEDWKTGFWIWAGEPPVAAGIKADILYVETPGRRWPRDLPDADEYVVVRRIDPSTALTEHTAAALANDFAALIEDARNHSTIIGLQIDYDCPSNKLEQYGQFLEQVRRLLPTGSRLSITALLDWFMPHTAVSSVLKRVDEFVPQFYDARSTRTSVGVAEPVDVAQWAPRFNAYRVPYRIGISSFGRIARRRSNSSGHSEVRFFRDVTPLDFARRHELSRSTGTTAAGELVVHYEVSSPLQDVPELMPGDAVDITFPTERSVRAAYEAVTRFGGYCAGVVFFRWPTRHETLTLLSDDVLRIVSGDPPSRKPTLEVQTPSCLERRCADLYLNVGSTVRSDDRTLNIHASGPIELFLPAGPLIQVSLRANQIAVQVPSYSGLGRIYLGRAVSSGLTQFEVVPQ